MNPLTLLYLPTAVALGGLHALEPGHAKTLTAAYLIGIKGTWRDAVLLGLSVAATHSIVVVGLAVTALWLGQEAFTDSATFFLQISSGIIVVLLGAWLFWRRWRIMQLQAKRANHQHDHDHNHHNHDHEDDDHNHAHDHHHDHHDHEHEHGHHHHHDHDDMTDDEHAAAHAATLPSYVGTGTRPTVWQIIAFGGAGGMIPCPASITVMLLALSVGKTGFGILTVMGFSLGLAITLVATGLIIVAGISKLESKGWFSWFTKQAPLFSAGLVMVSGLAALVLATLHH